MGRKTEFRTSGGRLNDVDGTITGYEWSPIFPYGSGEPRPWKSGEGSSLYFNLSVRKDGADEDVVEPYWAGNAERYEISRDGHTLTPLEAGDVKLGPDTEVSKLIRSLEYPADGSEGHPGASSDDPSVINFEPIIGTRVRFMEAPQLDKNGKAIKRIVKDGKYKGKSFDRMTVLVARVLDLPKPARRPNGKLARPGGEIARPAGRLSQASAAPALLKDLATSTLLDILSESENEQIPKAKLRMKVFAKLGTKHPQRDEVIKYLYNDENLAGIEGVSYQPSDKSQIIALA